MFGSGHAWRKLDSYVNSYLIDNPVADTNASSLGFASAQQMGSSVLGDFCKLVDGRWTEISSKAEAHPYWANKKHDEELLARRRSALCALFTADSDELCKLAPDNAWLNIKTRITALLDLLVSRQQSSVG